MSERWLGLKVASGSMILVAIDFEHDPPRIIGELTMQLPQGPRAEGYAYLHKRLADYIDQNKMTHVAVIGSAVSPGATKDSHLEAAELRGVALAASSAAGAHVFSMDMTVVSQSKLYGDKTAKQYIEDNSYWKDRFDVELKQKSRPSAYAIIAARISPTK